MNVTHISPQRRNLIVGEAELDMDGPADRMILLGDGGVACHELGEVQGVCAEAPLPCITVRERKYLLEGVGGIASMLRFWGVRPTVCCPLGHGEASQLQRKIFRAEGVRSQPLRTTAPQLTRYTRRFFAGGHQLAHVETEETIDPVSRAATVRSLAALRPLLAHAAIFCIVDKGNAGVTAALLAQLLGRNYTHKTRVIYEPRSNRLFKQCRCGVIKANHKQIKEWFGADMETDRDAIASTQLLLNETGARNAICTRGERGIVVCQRSAAGDEFFLISPQSRKLFDLVSAGDVVTAGLAFCIAKGRSLIEAACFAATAAELSLDRRHDKHLDVRSIVKYEHSRS
jgi:D-beta-D-heptose 7-phosphate kinase / D-beta-D-heptose 1-phosphate adenosyltransferase